MADPYLVVRVGRGGGVGGSFVLLALPAFLSSVIFFFAQTKGGPGPSPKFASDHDNVYVT